MNVFCLKYNFIKSSIIIWILTLAVSILTSGRLSAQKIELYHCMVDLNSDNKPIMEKYGIIETKLIDARYIDPLKKGKIDSTFLTKSIIEIFPDTNCTGMGLLDLEDQNFNVLLKGPEDPYFNEGLNEMIKMIRIAKTLRPNVTWSIYNIPYTSYWQKNELWKTQYQRLKPLFDYIDVLTPALYDFYPDTTKFSDDQKYYADNLNLALTIGQKTNKPVMPYIWHRWHEGNQKNGLLLIDRPEFKKNLNQIVHTKVDGIRINGLIWFDAQTFFYRIKDDLQVKDSKKLKIKKHETQVKVIDIYGRLIFNASKNEN